MKKSVWRTILKVIIAVATAIAGALGIQDVYKRQAEWRDQCQTVAYLDHLQRVAERTNAQRTGRFERRETVPQTEAKLTAIRHTGRGLLLSQGRPPVIPFRKMCIRDRPLPRLFFHE